MIRYTDQQTGSQTNRRMDRSLQGVAIGQILSWWVLTDCTECLRLSPMVMVTTACVPACCCAAIGTDYKKCLNLLLMMMMMTMMYLHAAAQLVDGLAAAMPTVLQPLCCMPCAQHSACRHNIDSDTYTHVHAHTHVHYGCAQALECPQGRHGGHGGCPRGPVGQGHIES